LPFSLYFQLRVMPRPPLVDVKRELLLLHSLQLLSDGSYCTVQTKP
jgi:hypothetical protein